MSNNVVCFVCFPQALSRVLLCSALPGYVLRAVLARLQYWKARIKATKRRRNDDTGMHIVKLLDVNISLARDGWDSRHYLAQTLSRGAQPQAEASQVKQCGLAAQQLISNARFLCLQDLFCVLVSNLRKE